MSRIGKPKLLTFDSYISAIKNSVGTKMFRNLFLSVNGRKTDVLKNGELSCAYFVSSILYLFDLIREKHATVNGILGDIQKSGWKAIRKSKIGCVILWDYKNGHRHVGFYVGGKLAISNDSKRKIITKHHWTYGADKNGDPKRKILALYWNDEL